MSLGIYKQGQGYWVRVMTAAMIGVITLATAAWLSSEALKVAEKLPTTSWNADLVGTATMPAQGQKVVLYGKGQGSDAEVELGTATVASVSESVVRLTDVSMKDAMQDPTAAQQVRSVEGATPAVNATIKDRAVRVPLIESTLLMGIVGAVVILIGACIGYYFTAVYQRFVDFLIATDGEMKKVNWSTMKDIRKSTTVVIFASLMLAASLFIVDFAFQWVFKAIGVLVS